MLSVIYISKNADVYISDLHNLMLFLLVALNSMDLQVFLFMLCIYKVLLIKQNINLVWELRLDDQIITVNAFILKTSDLKLQKIIFLAFYIENDFIYAQQLFNVTNIMGSYGIG